jgi:alpha-glucosidase
MSGWMADFGEWLPFNAQLADGEAAAMHNLYPTHWHRLNREVFAEAYPDGDFFLLTRSGFTASRKVAQVVWGGRPRSDLGRNGRSPTVIKAGLTLGLAGIPYFTHDIAAFPAVPAPRNSLCAGPNWGLSRRS